MRNKWLFVGISACLVVMVLTEPTIWFIVLSVYWMIRLVVYRHRMVLLVSVGISLLLAGRVMFWSQNSVLTESQTQFVIVVSARDIQVDGERLRAIGLIQSEKVIVQIRLQSPQEKERWLHQVADVRLHVEGILESLPEVRNPNQFDYKEYMKHMHRLYWQVDVTRYRVIEESINWLAQWHSHIKHELPEMLRIWVESLVFARRDDVLHHSFSKIGLLYVVSSSGIHVGLTLSLLRSIGKRIGITNETLTTLNRIVACGLLALNPNSIGVQKYVAVLLLPRRWRYLDKLAIVAILLIFYRPYSVWTLGFQLSFLLPILAQLTNRNPFFMWLATIPIFSFHFFEFSILPLILAPVCYVLLKRVLLPMTWLVAISVCLIPDTWHHVYTWIDVLLTQLTNAVEWLAQWHVLRIVTGRQTVGHYVVLLCAVIAGAYYWQLKRKWRSVMCFSVIVACCIPLPQTRFVMMDVGQGNSFLIQDGYDTMLIDTGGYVQFSTKENWKTPEKSKNIAETVVMPTLKSLGIGDLDKLVLTHDDVDHTGGAKRLQEEMPVAHIIVGAGAKTPASQEVVEGAVVSVGRYTFQVLSPDQKGNGENDDSIVLYGRFGAYRWLFMADASMAIEKQLMDRYPQLIAEVLQVGHHGSDTSTSQMFIDKIQPKIALISVGENNRFNHPNQEVLARLKDKIIYRSDAHGAVIYDALKRRWFAYKK